MFSNKEYLAKKTGLYGIGRLSYLQQLINEFQDSQNIDAKRQVLANLANFAYDPINYDYMWQLNITDLFLDCLDESDSELMEYAIGGICNIALDKRHKEHILKSGGVPLIVKCISSSNAETVISAITSLMFLMSPLSAADITSLPIVEAMLRLSRSSNCRLSNLAQIFLKDHCTEQQVREAEAAEALWEQQEKATLQLVQQHAGIIADSRALSGHALDTT